VVRVVGVTVEEAADQHLLSVEALSKHCPDPALF
jgi:hypothetical protein